MSAIPPTRSSPSGQVTKTDDETAVNTVRSSSPTPTGAAAFEGLAGGAPRSPRSLTLNPTVL